MTSLDDDEPLPMETQQPKGRPTPSNPRVLVFSCDQMKLTSLTPFQRKDGCDRFGKVLRCERLRDGSLEVEFASGNDASRALRAKTFTYSKRDRSGKRDVFLPITVAPHRTKNYTRGVISCYELRDTSDEEIVDGLSDTGVIEAKRITVRRGGNSLPTDSVILTFDRSQLPSDVVVGYTRVRVRPYIPNPMRCFRCQRFGHTRTHCRNRPICAKCASTEHLDEDCQADTFRCVNCDDGQTPHTSYDRKCPAFIKEQEINSIKVTRNVSFKEARSMYDESHPSVSYAQKVGRTPVPSKVGLEQMTASQLVQLLRKYGLSVVAAGPSSEMAVAPVDSPQVPTELASSSSRPGGGGAPAAPPETPAVEASTARTRDGDDGWTLVQGRRMAGRDRQSPTRRTVPGAFSGTANRAPGRPPPKETAVMAALRRNEEEKRARDARRARLVERAREARQSPEADSDSGTAGAAPLRMAAPPTVDPAGRPPSSLSSGSASSMGPPPPPPRRPHVPPPPPPDGPLPGDNTLGTPQSTPRPLEPPRAPVRPGKRAHAFDSSPSEGGTPRSRQRPHSRTANGRASSADGRLLHGDGSHPRIQFRDDDPPGT